MRDAYRASPSTTRSEHASLQRFLRDSSKAQKQGDAKAKTKTQYETKGVSLPYLKAIMCMDFVDRHCYIDIQRCSGVSRTVILPGQLAPGLQEWDRYWGADGGKFSHKAAARFKVQALACDKQAAEMARLEGLVFGD